MKASDALLKVFITAAITSVPNRTCFDKVNPESKLGSHVGDDGFLLIRLVRSIEQGAHEYS